MTHEGNLANFHTGELRPLSPGRPETPLDIVAIGASADGVTVISELLEQLPHNLAAAVLVVLHRPIERVSHLHHILARRLKVPVLVPEEGQRLKKGCCFLSEPQQHLTISPSLRIHLLPNSFYRSHNIDALFCSLARHAGRRTIGVILSGMLKDGALGIRAIKEAGGVALVQSPEEAAHPDMPRNAIQTGGAIDLVGPVDELAREICRLVGESASRHRTAQL